MAAKTQLTLAEFERLPDDGKVHELNRGELVSVGPPKLRHSLTAHKIQAELSKVAQAKGLGIVLLETAYLLSSDPTTVRIPDVSFITSERFKGLSLDDYVPGAPALAVEIASPSDSVEELREKAEQYLAAGSRRVWVVYPQTRKVHVYRTAAAPLVLNESQDLDAPDLFPNWSVRVGKLM